MVIVNLSFTHHPGCKATEDSPAESQSVEFVSAEISEQFPILKKALDKLKLLSQKEYDDFMEPIIDEVWKNYQDEALNHALAAMLEEEADRRLEAHEYNRLNALDQ